jgi:hypothetical protein
MHCEHGAVDDAYLSSETRIPFALVDRLLVEIMRSGRTFISSALISAFCAQAGYVPEAVDLS